MCWSARYMYILKNMHDIALRNVVSSFNSILWVWLLDITLSLLGHILLWESGTFIQLFKPFMLSLSYSIWWWWWKDSAKNLTMLARRETLSREWGKCFSLLVLTFQEMSYHMQCFLPLWNQWRVVLFNHAKWWICIMIKIFILSLVSKDLFC